jgi:hypothetical protein
MNDTTQQERERKEAKLKVYRTRSRDSESIWDILRSQGAIELRLVSEEELETWRKVEPPICTFIVPLQS